MIQILVIFAIIAALVLIARHKFFRKLRWKAETISEKRVVRFAMLIAVLALTVYAAFQLNSLGRKQDELGRRIDKIIPAPIQDHKPDTILDKFDSALTLQNISILLRRQELNIDAKLEAFKVDIKNELKVEPEIEFTRYTLFVTGLLLIGIGLLIQDSNERYLLINLFGITKVNSRRSVISLICYLAGLACIIVALFDIFDFARTKPDQKIECNCDCKGSGVYGANFSKIIKLSSFEEGYDTFPPRLKDSLWIALKDSLERDDFYSLHIFGGVDKQQLIGKAKEKFGDNLSLAYARAVKIKGYINGLKNDKAFNGHLDSTVLITYGGGAEYYSGYNTDSLAAERSVTVWGVKKPKKE
ncbi:MAG TPA: hypothetical protein VFI06_04385 [Chitinophagaceae bacterium]|nr:hypothetical protein [Chitinophagaceae bacterium]